MKSKNRFLKIGMLGLTAFEFAPSLTLCAQGNELSLYERILQSLIEFFCGKKGESKQVDSGVFQEGENNKGSILKETSEEDIKKLAELKTQLQEKIKTQKDKLRECEEKLQSYRSRYKELEELIKNEKKQIENCKSKEKNCFNEKHEIDENALMLAEKLRSLGLKDLVDMTACLERVASSSGNLGKDKKSVFEEWYRGLVENVETPGYSFNFDLLDKKFGIRSLSSRVLDILNVKGVTLEKDSIEDGILCVDYLDLSSLEKDFTEEERVLIDEYKSMSGFIFDCKCLLEDYAKYKKNVEGLKECIMDFNFKMLKQKVEELKSNLVTNIEDLIKKIENYSLEYGKYFDVKDLMKSKDDLCESLESFLKKGGIVSKNLQWCLVKVGESNVSGKGFILKRVNSIECFSATKENVDEKIKEESEEKERLEQDIRILEMKVFEKGVAIIELTPVATVDDVLLSLANIDNSKQ